MPDQVVVTSTSAKLLGLSDFWKGLIVAIITAPLTIIYTSIQAGKFDIDWKAILLVAAAGLVSYLLKNLGSAPVTTITPAPGATAGESVTVKIPAPGQKITQTIDK